MPFKHYHGRTGVVFNVTKRAIGVVVNKEVHLLYIHYIIKIMQVNGRIIRKQLHIATHHLLPSTCQSQIIQRKKDNESIKKSVRNGI